MLILLAYLGGILTILSPCILPVLPFVFARTGGPFAKSTLPMLGGMAAAFAAVATLAAVGGGWAVHANQAGRFVALVLLALFGLTLLIPSLADRLARPILALGARISSPSASANEGRRGASVGGSLVLGVAIGMLWAPCAGPILGLVLTGAALQGASVGTSLLLFAYAAGAATSLAVALLAGGRVFAALKRSLGTVEWIRRGLGAAVLLGVAAIATGLDTGLLTKWSLGNTTRLEEVLLSRVAPDAAPPGVAQSGDAVEGVMPPLPADAVWLNTPPLTTQELRGKVVVVDFWTYSCINCLRSLPYVRGWADKYRDHGLVVIGVHSPEFGFEKDVDNVRRAVANLHVDYPVLIDNDLTVWRAFRNQYWPAHYFIDAQGRIRHHHFGEGDYEGSERFIRMLLIEAGYRDIPGGAVVPDARGAQAPASARGAESPETYIGYGRADRFVSGPAVRDATHEYTVPPEFGLDDWGLGGRWTVGREHAVLDRAPGRITFRFQARDVHLVLGPAANGKPVRFRVTIDGAPPDDAHGADTNEDGDGVVTEQRLYQLIRLPGAPAEHTFEIEFLDPGVSAFAFTFG